MSDWNDHIGLALVTSQDSRFYGQQKHPEAVPWVGLFAYIISLKGSVDLGSILILSKVKITHSLSIPSLEPSYSSPTPYELVGC